VASKASLVLEPSATALQVGAGSASGPRLASSGDGEPQPFLLTRLAYPQATAKALRAVSDMAGSRFYVPPAMLARILREADPVATVSPEAIRFESFSACCSAYMRLDLDDDALAETTRRSSGTTNVDFGKAMKQALATVRPDAALSLQIASSGVSVQHERGAAVEEKVPLPLRWIRGFAEVQHHMAGMEHRFSLGRVAALRFLRSLPRSKDDRQTWVSLTGGSARIGASQIKGAVPLTGAHRLALLERPCLFATGIDVFWNRELGSSAWVLNLPGQRLTIVVNAQPWRGFSGDGRLLSWLARADDRSDALLRAQLNWQTSLDEASLAASTGLAPEDIRSGLARLAATGLVGYDLMRRSWFHRRLPFDLSRLEQLNPRLKAASELVAKAAVSIGPDGTTGHVSSADVVHAVTVQDGELRCTCPWFAKNGTTRGPCKHALAFELTMQCTAND
jgi:hypothetical protein